MPDYMSRLTALEKLIAERPAGMEELTDYARQFEQEVRFQLGLADMLGESPKLITKRMTQMHLAPKQAELWNTLARFVTVPAGRRSGKTELAKRRLIDKAIRETRYDDAWFVASAPTLTQAKRIFWRDLKRMTPTRFLVGKPIESGEPTLTFWNGASITVMGMEVPERVEGNPLNGIVLDEYGNMKPTVWLEHVRPALSDRQGWAWFTGVPEGRNHYYDLSTQARLDTTGVWANFSWHTADVLYLYLGKEAADAELESAMKDMDELTFNQEYKADFITFTGLAYYTFGDWNISKTRLPYRPEADLIFCFDFNVSPGVAVVLQEMVFETNGERRKITYVIGEVHIPRSSNTPRVCDRLIKDWGQHKGRVLCYGDATGGSEGTAKVDGNDWALIKQKLRPVFGDRVRFRVDMHNPLERVRVNAVNGRLKSMAGIVSLLIDAAKCPNLIKDFEGVRVLEGGSGEIDKDFDPKATHLTDAIGYYIEKTFPLQTGFAQVRTEQVI